MSCSNCSNGNGTPAGCRNNGNCGPEGCDKLQVTNWLGDIANPDNFEPYHFLEVRFKNSRKEFYFDNGLSLRQGDVVVVEAKMGHDVGVVSLTGDLVKIQMNRKNVIRAEKDFLKVVRIANQKDIDKWQKAISLETNTMIESRKLAKLQQLDIKISDVEFQGDHSKAIFYYTSESRVDFRDLVKDMAKNFGVRIEMKQIGMRQEASRLGGLGSCGRELCCSSWLSDMRSVSSSAARYQQLSLNPAKLAGQCGKLKCCLNYELDVYTEELKSFPDTEIPLKTKKGTATFQKMDIFRKKMWYAYEDEPYRFIEIPLEKVNEILEKNKKGKKVDSIEDLITVETPEVSKGFDLVGQANADKFDVKKKFKKKKKGKRNHQKNKNKRPSNGVN